MIIGTILFILYLLGIVGMIIFTTYIDIKTDEFDYTGYPELTVALFLLDVLWFLNIGWIVKMYKELKKRKAKWKKK